MGGNHSSQSDHAAAPAPSVEPLLHADDPRYSVPTAMPNSHHLSAPGLTSAEVADRLAKFGYNEVEAQQTHILVKLLQKFWGPMPWLIEVAAIVSAALGDSRDLVFLLSLLVVNALVALAEESRAAAAIDSLRDSLAPQARVMRDGQWTVLDARELVPDDTVLLRQGDVVPADACLGAGCEPIEIDQSALTGEALPVSRIEGELIYQGCVITRGEAHASVTATGKLSFFGKSATGGIDTVERPGRFQMVLLLVGRA